MVTQETIPRDERYGLTAKIIKCAIDVHSSLGPGFIERIYHRSLIVELTAVGLSCATEVQVPVYHRGVVVGRHELDLLVEGVVVIELKAVKRLDSVHFAQVRSYLAATGLEIGLLFNFGGFQLETRRVFNPEERKAFLGSRASRVPAPIDPELGVASRTRTRTPAEAP